MKIIEAFYDGFRGYAQTGISIIRDNISLKDHPFQKEDMVRIDLELEQKKRLDEVSDSTVKFHIAIFQLASNGFYTKTYKEDENPYKGILFYESRGMITSPSLIKNPFEVGDLLKITVKKSKWH